MAVSNSNQGEAMVTRDMLRDTASTLAHLWRGLMTRDAEAFLAVSFLVVMALAGWALGGWHYGI